MNRNELLFDRPDHLQATAPPEARGLARDEVRLLVSHRQADGQSRHEHAHFYELADFLNAGDLLVVNRSATLAASLPATGPKSKGLGNFRLNLSTNYGSGLWLAEPRWSSDRPGPLPLTTGETIDVGGQPAQMIAPHPELSRLWWVQMDADACLLSRRVGEPIRYGYLDQPQPLDAYQTIFARVPGSAEMPSAARPFSQRVLRSLRKRGVHVAGLTLHTGVSSLEVESERVEEHALFAEPFHVPVATARAVNRTRAAGGRVVAVGTTVVRALESAWNAEENKVMPARGFTRAYIHPARGVNVVDGLISGLHDPLASHLAMLYAIAGQPLIREAYGEAVREGYLWHEFGDSHLILPGKR